MALSIKAAAYIVTIALIGTIFLAAVDIHQEPTTVTTYEQVTDLTPLVVYEDVESYKSFNPTTNVTGWGNVTFQTQSTPTQYIVSSTPAEVTTVNTTAHEIPGAVWFTAAGIVDNNGNVYSPAGGIPAGKTAVGGKSTYIPGPEGSPGYYQRVFYNTHGYHYWDYVIDLNKLASKVSSGNETFVVTSEYGYFRYSTDTTSFNYYASGSAGSTRTYEMDFRSPDSNDYPVPYNYDIAYDRSSDSFHRVSGYDELNNPVIDYSTTYKSVVFYDHVDEPLIDDPNPAIQYRLYAKGEYNYVSSYTFVTIEDGQTASWINGYNNGSVQLVVEPSAEIKAGNRLFTAPGSMSGYPLMLVTLDDINQEYYAQGITTAAPDLSNVSVVEYRYPLTVTPIGDIVTLQPNYLFIPTRHYIPQFDPESDGEQILHSRVTILPPDFLNPQLASVTVNGENATVSGLTVNVSDLVSDVVIQYAQSGLNINSLILHVTGDYVPDDEISRLEITGTTKAYVTNTMIPADPLGRLWQNPTISVAAYFPNVYESGARVMISGYTTAGDSVTVNGQTFGVSDGYVQIHGNSYSIKGMAVDYKDGHTFLVFTQHNNRTFDLGETVTTAVTFGGIWYFASALNEINESVVDTTQVTIGQGAIDQNTVIFVFVSLLIVGALIGSYFIRGGISPIDWLIILVAGAFALVMVS